MITEPSIAPAQEPISKQNYTDNERLVHSRGGPEVLRKISRVYDIPPEELALPPSTAEKILDEIDTLLQEDDWSTRRDSWRKAPNATETEKLNSLAKAMMLQYVQAFHVRTTVAHKVNSNAHLPTDEYHQFYRRAANRNRLVETYKGHVANNVQATLEECTEGNEAAATRINRFLVKHSLRLYKQYTNRDANLDPNCMQAKSAHQCIDWLKKHTDKQATDICDAFHEANRDPEKPTGSILGKLYRAERIRKAQTPIER